MLAFKYKKYWREREEKNSKLKKKSSDKKLNVQKRKRHSKSYIDIEKQCKRKDGRKKRNVNNKKIRLKAGKGKRGKQWEKSKNIVYIYCLRTLVQLMCKQSDELVN